jgi:hypothetical protein
MPMSSAEIAALNGAFSQQNMMRMQYSGMVAPEYNFGALGHRAGQEGIAARGMSMASAVGGPMAGLGMGLMGLDPLSMGVRGGAAAMGGGFGVAGGAMAGLAVGGGMMAGLGAISYMGNQVMNGMQQTQQFNQGMRGGYSFFNPMSSTGRGFGEGGIREIGNHMRSIAGSGGPQQFGSGMMDGFSSGPDFNELGRLAANMGRMGLADGVRNVKEFKEKFSEMIKTVTAIATDMGSTLEEAQKAMAAMKGSGIFNRQGSIASSIRNASVAGGLATTEVTGMMNVGSQISRMFGGTGRQGARGGIESIAQVGTAVQTGALSEEDIYQATGMVGAEGRRAMAQQQMLQTGSFLKSGKGRYLLASLAGKDGKLDADSVANFMSGGMSVDDTRAAAHGNLSKVGRANFIRNEGRLRGAVMEEFGGLAPAMAMMGWAQGKGIDINSMGDREMLFMQRQMGVGRDEADAMVKMARKMPSLLEARRNARADDAGIQEHQLREQSSGLEGIKRKLESARDTVNNEMQKVGQDILNSATDKIAEWGNRLAGTYEEHMIEGIRSATQAASLGGSRGREIMQGMIGGKGFLSNIKMDRGSMQSLHEDIGQKNFMSRQSDLQFSARMGSLGGMSSEQQSLVQNNSSALKKAYAEDLSGLSGEDRLAGFKRSFGKDTELGKSFRKMDAHEQARFMQQMEGQIGLKNGMLSETFDIAKFADLRGGNGLYTEAQRNESTGRAVLGMKSAAEQAAGSSATTDAMGNSLGFSTQDSGAGESRGSANAARAAGAMFDSAESRQVAFDVLSGNKGAKDKLYAAISNLKGGAAARGGKLTDEEKGQLGFYSAVDMTADINARGGLDSLTDKDWNELILRQKKAVAAVGGDPATVSRASIEAQTQGVKGAAVTQQAEMLGKMSKQVGASATSDARVLQAGGIAALKSGKNGEVLQLTSEALKRMPAGSAAAQAARMALDASNLGLRAERTGDMAEKHDLMSQWQDTQDKLHAAMGGMSVKDLKAFGSQMVGTSIGSEASELLMRGQSLTAGTRKNGAAGAIAAQLGLNLGADEMAALKGKSAEAGAAAIAARLGVGDDKNFTSGLQEAIAAASKKGGGIQGAQLLQRALIQADDGTKKKLEEMAKGQASPEEKIVDKLSEGNKFLEALVQSNKAASAKLAEIAGNTNKPDAEKPPA